jgi:hypothetical protein
MAEAGVIDAARQEEFVGKVVQQIGGTMTPLLGAIGDSNVWHVPSENPFNNLYEAKP